MREGTRARAGGQWAEQKTKSSRRAIYSRSPPLVTGRQREREAYARPLPRIFGGRRRRWTGSFAPREEKEISILPTNLKSFIIDSLAAGVYTAATGEGARRAWGNVCMCSKRAER